MTTVNDRDIEKASVLKYLRGEVTRIQKIIRDDYDPANNEGDAAAVRRLLAQVSGIERMIQNIERDFHRCEE